MEWSGGREKRRHSLLYGAVSCGVCLLFLSGLQLSLFLRPLLFGSLFHTTHTLSHACLSSLPEVPRRVSLLLPRARSLSPAPWRTLESEFFSLDSAGISFFFFFPYSFPIIIFLPSAAEGPSLLCEAVRVAAGARREAGHARSASWEPSRAATLSPSPISMSSF